MASSTWVLIKALQTDLRQRGASDADLSEIARLTRPYAGADMDQGGSGDQMHAITLMLGPARGTGYDYNLIVLKPDPNESGFEPCAQCGRTRMKG